MKRRTIGKLAKETGVGVETVRFYERKGILHQPPKPTQGYRTYSERDLVTIRLTKQAQELKLSLADVQGLMDVAERNTPKFCVSVRGVVRKKLAHVKKQIAELEAVRVSLEDFLVKCSARKGPSDCPILAQLQSCPKDC